MPSSRKVEPGDIVRYLRDDNPDIEYGALMNVIRPVQSKKARDLYVVSYYGDMHVLQRRDFQLCAPPGKLAPGVRVRLISAGELYPRRIDWLISRNVDPELMCRFAYGDDLGYSSGRKMRQSIMCTVIDYDPETEVAFVLADTGEAYLVNRIGLSTYFYRKEANK